MNRFHRQFFPPSLTTVGGNLDGQFQTAQTPSLSKVLRM